MDVIAGALLFFALMVGLLATGFVLAKRWIRRRIRLLTGTLGLVGLVARGRRSGVSWTMIRPALSAGWWPAQVLHHRMWRAVDGAELAVAHAQESGAPVGDLPRHLPALRNSAELVDRSLVVRSRSTGGGDRLVEPGRQAADVIRAAEHVQQAATTSLHQLCGPRVGRATGEARDEARAVLAGVASVTRDDDPLGH